MTRLSGQVLIGALVALVVLVSAVLLDDQIQNVRFARINTEQAAIQMRANFLRDHARDLSPDDYDRQTRDIKKMMALLDGDLNTLLFSRSLLSRIVSLISPNG